MNREQLQDLACDRFATALTESILADHEKDDLDSESIRYMLHDLNDLLRALHAGPGAEVQPRFLRDPAKLEAHLRSALELSAQLLAKELPNRLKAWLAEEPKPSHPDRPAWAAHGRWLLDQARLSGDD